MDSSVKQNFRDSNIELARIVAMAMVVVGHFIFHGIQHTVIPSPASLPVLGCSEIVILCLSVLCTAGVGLFMLISGFYSIRLRWKSLLSFWMLCVFYNAVNLFVNTPVSQVGATQLLDMFFISRTPNWFFQGYFWVMMASPVINKALEGFDIKALRCLAVIGLVLVGVSSWKFANPKGNTALLLMVLYFLGGYVRREPKLQNITKKQSLTTYFALVVIGTIIGIVTYDVFHKEYGIFFQHNSLLVIAMASCLFLFFHKCEIRSKFINTWASTVVAALFIQDVIMSRPLYEYVNGLYINEGLSAHLWLVIAALTLAVFAAAFIIEWPRKKVAGAIADALSVRLNRIVNLGEILGNEKKQA